MAEQTLLHSGESIIRNPEDNRGCFYWRKQTEISTWCGDGGSECWGHMTLLYLEMSGLLYTSTNNLTLTYRQPGGFVETFLRAMGILSILYSSKTGSLEALGIYVQNRKTRDS